MDDQSRRNFLRAAGATGVVTLLAGCSAEETEPGDGADDDSTATPEDEETDTPEDETETPDDDEDAETPTLTIATYESFVDAPSTSPGPWLKEEFESEFDAEIEWTVPPNDVNQLIEQANAGAEIDADLYVGLTTDDLIRVDENLEDGELFAEAGEIDGDEDIREGLQFDPHGRAVPFDTGYISLVYNEYETEAPETFEGLLDPEHEGELLAQSPSGSQTGQAFLLHTIHELGEDEYLDYWADLQDNGVNVQGSWSDSYAAYEDGEAPMVVSYSTDQVFANMEGADLSEHQIRFLNDQAYANPEGMGVVAETDVPDLAREFMSFMLRPEVQGEIAERNVAFPATETAELDPEYDQFAHEPPEAVTFTYEELEGNLSEWIDEWERQFASN